MAREHKIDRIQKSDQVLFTHTHARARTCAHTHNQKYNINDK